MAAQIYQGCDSVLSTFYCFCSLSLIGFNYYSLIALINGLNYLIKGFPQPVQPNHENVKFRAADSIQSWSLIIIV